MQAPTGRHNLILNRWGNMYIIPKNYLNNFWTFLLKENNRGPFSNNGT